MATNEGVTGLRSNDRISPSPVPTDVVGKVKAKTIATWGTGQWDAMYKLVESESGFQNEWNKSGSSAFGIFQALPFSKTGCAYEDIDCQITWGVGYIKQRYQTPELAWQFHVIHGYY